MTFSDSGGETEFGCTDAPVHLISLLILLLLFVFVFAD